ncbi:poly [ADP-ribose] polymerase 2 isoform X2 [Lepisosteus oculatus]|uniref:poly [ADP-ribose] polymerase 2 isoform X2 n=1 Tax=Lepisosteus oculatus TaxID=7918 RepID=UPI00372237A4
MPRTRGSRNRTEVSAEETAQTEQKPESLWQWQDDDGSWKPYSPAVCAKLGLAAQAGRASVSVPVGSGKYTVDLKKMTQINSTTKFQRAVRSEQPANGDDGGGDSANTVKEEPEEEQPIAKRRKGDRAGGRSQKVGPAAGSSNDSTDSKEVVKRVVFKGRAPVDAECKAKLGKAHVYCEGEDVYDVMLNQTNVQFNNNKYYLIQLLQDDGPQVYSVWMRWGRVGKSGQNSLVPCGGDLNKAKDVFKKKFFDKTKNEWEDRSRFEKVAGKYDIVHMDYSTEEKEEEKPGAQLATQPKRPESKLDQRVQALLELICDLKAMEECVLEMKFDTKKAPLGKLTPQQIKGGYEALKRIEECLNKKKTSKELLEACNTFYTRIPHDFGLRTPPLIRSEQELKEKIALLEALSDIQIAVKMVQSSASGDEHPLDRQYHTLCCELEPVEPSSQEYQLLERYLQSTHASTHSDYTMTVLDIFTVNRKGEEEAFCSHLHNRTLLWHGSRLSNWVGILNKGLRVAPPEAPVTGYMFGKGIYFADMSSKSANYCFANQKNSTGLLLLSEVALGDCNELLHADYNADKLPPGKHSTKGLGQTAPDPRNAVALDGVGVPLGPAVRTGVANEQGYTLLYNEFVVYDPNQVRMRFLLRVRFNYPSPW